MRKLRLHRRCDVDQLQAHDQNVLVRQRGELGALCCASARLRGVSGVVRKLSKEMGSDCLRLPDAQVAPIEHRQGSPWPSERGVALHGGPLAAGDLLERDALVLESDARVNERVAQRLRPPARVKVPQRHCWHTHGRRKCPLRRGKPTRHAAPHCREHFGGLISSARSPRPAKVTSRREAECADDARHEVLAGLLFGGPPVGAL